MACRVLPAFAAGIFAAGAACAGTIEMAYPQEQGIEQGPGRFAFDYLRAAEMVTQDSGVSVRWVALPLQRMFHRLKLEEPDFCIGGAGVTPERRELGKFTMPFIEDRMIGVIALKSRRAALDRAHSLTDLSRSDSTFLAFPNLNYGEAVTPLLEDLRKQDRVVAAPPGIIQVVDMVARNRADFALVSLRYTANLLATRPDRDDFVLRTYPDMHRDFHMAFLCSKGVPDTVMDRLDEAVQRQEAAIQAKFHG